MFWAVTFLVLWIIGLVYGGSVYWRADVAGRYVGGSWGIGWALLGILGWVTFQKFMK